MSDNYELWKRLQDTATILEEVELTREEREKILTQIVNFEGFLSELRNEKATYDNPTTRTHRRGIC